MRSFINFRLIVSVSIVAVSSKVHVAVMLVLL